MELNNVNNMPNLGDHENGDPVDNLSRDLFVRHHQNARKREQGMRVRLAEEVGIPADVVGHYGSEIQGKMPHDFSGYDRSRSSAS